MIGRGRTGTVYLALHKELEEYRAVKAVAKSSLRYETFRKEALLLKELRHPGIPVIYDIEEDEAYSYLVEEYLQGESLETLVKTQGPLARCTVLKYVIQICGVVNYLHSAGTEPILHLDLQPKNLLVCHETIKLVDFGQAAGLTEANKATARFGTVGFAAPEQYDCRMKLDERTDIYAIGGLLYFLATGTYPDREETPVLLGMRMWSREAGRIAAACLEPVKEDRYGSVSQLKKDLENLLERPVSSLVVAVYGLEPCVGTTHISLALCAYLWKLGLPNLYEECHSSDHIRRLAEIQGLPIDSYGSLQVFGCVLKPCYGRQVQFRKHQYPIVIQDRGVWGKGEGFLWNEVPTVQLVVAGGKWWNLGIEKMKENGCKIFQDNTVILYNFSDQQIPVKRPEKKGIQKKWFQNGRFQNGQIRSQLLRVPLFSNPFYPDRQAMEWLELLWSLVEGCAENGAGSSRGNSTGNFMENGLENRNGKRAVLQKETWLQRTWRKMQRLMGSCGNQQSQP